VLYTLYLLATIIGVGIFIWQTFLLRKSANASKTSADAAERAANIADQTLRLTQRADVLVEKASIEHSGENLGPHSRLVLVFKNFGQTRASEVQLTARLTVPETQNLPEEPALLPITLGAGGEQRVLTDTFGKTFTQDTFRKIMSGEIVLRFDGTAIYRDAFKNVHTTTCGGYFHLSTRSFIIDKNSAD
jgi:hypothetical protein